MIGCVGEDGVLVGHRFEKGQTVWITVDSDGDVKIHLVKPTLSIDGTHWVNKTRDRLLIDQKQFKMLVPYKPTEPCILEYVI